MEHEVDLWNAFRKNRKYYCLISEWHGEHAGCAAEDVVKDMVLAHARGLVLDAGCGEGSITKWFAHKLQSTEFRGVDISPVGIEMAQRNSLRNCSFQVGELEQLHMESGVFDCAYCLSVLEHVRNLESVISELHRVLKVGGKLIIRVGNGARHGQSLFAALIKTAMRRNKIRRITPSCQIRSGYERSDIRAHFDAFEIPSDVLLTLLRKRGFRILSFSTTAADQPKRTGGLRSSLGRLIPRVPVFPFVHLGWTTVVLAQKE